MQEDIYQNWVLPLKNYQKDPLQLHQLPIKKDRVYGYSIQDSTFLFKHFAKQNNGFYFDVADFLEAVHLKDNQRIDFYKQQLKNKKKIITPELGMITDSEQKHISSYWLPLFTELKEVWKDTSMPERRLIIPLHLQFGDMIPHIAIVCFNFKMPKNEADVIILEQHAQNEGQPNYEPDFDYIKGLKIHLGAFSAILKQKDCGLLGIEKVNTFINERPICRRHNVCGVVVGELARQFLETDDPIVLAKSGIVITNEEVDKLHERNQKLEAKYGYFPLMVIQTNRGRK